MSVPAGHEATGDACLRCGGPIRWIDTAWSCGEGCLYCADCAEELGGVCGNDSGELRAVRRTAPVGRAAKPAAPSAEGLK